MSSAVGHVVTAVVPFDGGRGVSVYVQASTPEVVVFAADGQLIAPWGARLEGAGLPPTMVVGLRRLSDETLRI